LVEGDGALGAPGFAPFDRIVLRTGTWEIFPAWLEQLTCGGRLVAPVILGESQSGSCVVVNLVRVEDHLVGRPGAGVEMVRMRGKAGGARVRISSRAGSAWRPTSTAALRSIRVYPRFARLEPGPNQKLLVRGRCQILFERGEALA
jgi:protein-L-isoaspartate O-methyltransferase